MKEKEIKMAQSKKINLYNVLKFIAIILVLFSHSTYITLNTTYGNGDYFNITDNLSLFYRICKKLVEIVYIFHMPLFIAISGALFRRTISKENFEIEQCLKGKVKTLIVPYFAYGILYSIVIKFIVGYYSITNVTGQIVYGTLLGHDTMQYIWFLPTLFLIMCLFYIICCIGLKRDKKKILIFLGFLCLFHGQINISFPGVKFFSRLFIFFIIGFLFEEYREKFENLSNVKLYIFAILSFAVTIILHRVHYHMVTSEILYNITEVLLILGFILTILFIAIRLERIKRLINNKLFNTIGNHAFDIYILADPLNYILLSLVAILGISQVYATNIGSIIFILIRTIGLLFASLGISKIIEKFLKTDEAKKKLRRIFWIIVLGSIIAEFLKSFI